MGDEDRGFGGAFGRIPSQQVKIDENKELSNLVKNYKTAAIIIFVLLSFLYVSFNLMLGRADWYEAINITEIALSFLGFVALKRLMESKFEGVYILGDEKRVYLSSNVAISFVACSALFAYVHINMTDFLVELMRFPEERGFFEIIKSLGRTGVIFATLALIAPSIAIVVRLILNEILDATHSALEVRVNKEKLALEYAKLQEEHDRYWAEHGEVIDQAPEITKPTLVFGNVKRTALPAPMNLHAVAMAEFLDGIRDGLWTTSERSWGGKRLERSGYNLSAVGDELRDALIKAQWAEWNHPEKKNLGWFLVEKAEIVKDQYLGLRGSNGADGRTTGQNSEGTGADVSGSAED
jgi:hypothetical protein